MDDEREPAGGTPPEEPGAPSLPPAPPDPDAPEPWVEVPTPVPVPAKSRTGMIVAIVVLLVVGLIAIVVLTAGGGGLPDELAGQPRITSGPTAEILEAFDDLEVEGVSMDIAVYGPELAPTYMVMTASGDIPGEPGNLLGTLPTGVFSGQGASIDFTRSIEATVDGVEYVCAPAANTDVSMSVSMCLFAGNDVGGMVMGLRPGALQTLMTTTQAFVADL